MKIDLNELEALARAATPGPWLWDGRTVDADDGYVHIPECSYIVGLISLAGHYEGYQEDCDFIAAANPAAVLELIALARQAHVTEAVAIPQASEERALDCAAQPVQQTAPVACREPLVLLTLGGIEDDEYGDFDLEVISSKVIERLQAQLVHGRAPVVLELFAAPVPAASVDKVAFHNDGSEPDWVEHAAEEARDAVPCARVQPFQQRVQPWMMACFGAEISADTKERNHRFFEESAELVQAYGMTASEAHQLVDYVYGRPVGEPAQEVGGVMVTLAALCLANGLDMDAAAETELARIWTKVEAIRAKQAAKPKHSPLPQAVQPANGRDAALLEQAAQACDQQADGTNGPYRSACLQCADAVRELRDAASKKGGA